MDIKVRAIADLRTGWPVVWPLIDLLVGEHAELVGFPLKPGHEKDLKRFHEQLFVGPGRQLLVAEDERGAAAIALAAVDSDGSGSISEVIVRPDLHGLGLGSELAGRAESWLREAAAPEVHCIVAEANTAAMRFWLRRGYQPASQTLMMRGPQSTAFSDSIRRMEKLEPYPGGLDALVPGCRKQACMAAISRALTGRGRVFIADGPAGLRGVLAVRLGLNPCILPLLEALDARQAAMYGASTPSGRAEWHHRRLSALIWKKSRVVLALRGTLAIGMVAVQVLRAYWPSMSGERY